MFVWNDKRDLVKWEFADGPEAFHELEFVDVRQLIHQPVDDSRLAIMVRWTIKLGATVLGKLRKKLRLLRGIGDRDADGTSPETCTIIPESERND
jgi:hypothetical protein